MSWFTAFGQRTAVQEAAKSQQFEVTKPLVLVNGAGDATTPHVWIETPSRRISAWLEIFYEPEPGANPVNSFASSVWTLTGRTFGQHSSDLTLHTLESAQAMPRAYELDSQMRMVRAVATCNVPLDSGAAVVNGRWLARGRWEPNITMDPRELEAFFTRCRLYAQYTRDS